MSAARNLRATGAGIYVYENGLRVLEAFGAYDAAIATAPLASARARCATRPTAPSPPTHSWGSQPPASIRSSRQRVIDALAASCAARQGAEIVTGSEIRRRAAPMATVAFADWHAR